MFDITVEYQPNPEAIGAIHEGLKAFNETHRFTSTRYGLPKGCADKGSAVSYCEGLGKYPSPNGCRYSYLRTGEYQARPFYEARGYVAAGVLEDFPAGSGYRLTFLWKVLGRTQPTSS